jgi:histidine triad (HIT) family protein
MENCVFCKIARGEIPSYKIWEDDSYIAFLDQHPIQIGHTLLIPKKHSDYLFDLEQEEYMTILLHAKDLAHILKEKLHAERIGMAVEGFGVPHVHLHLVPINHGNELNPERATHPKQEELKKIADQILN